MRAGQFVTQLTEPAAAAGAPPGVDGLTADFYVRHSKAMAPILSEIFKEAWAKGKMPDDMRGAITTLAYKGKGLPRDVWKSYRPISVTMIAYRIMGRCMQLSLGPIMPRIIGESQPGFIPGRSIDDDVLAVCELANFCEAEGRPGLFVMLDNEKAYDRVQHSFLLETLDAFGFPPEFVTMVRVLLQDMYTRLKVNGHIGDALPATNSVRQGCVLAPSLYALVHEVFLIMIRRQRGIGISVPGAEGSLDRPFCMKERAFADDTGVALASDRQLDTLFNVMRDFQDISGAKFGMDKAIGLRMGPLKDVTPPAKYRSGATGIRWYDYGVDEIPTKDKYLGIKFATPDLVTKQWEEKIAAVEAEANAAMTGGAPKSYAGRSAWVKNVFAAKTWYTFRFQLPPARERKRVLTLFQRMVDGLGIGRSRFVSAAAAKRDKEEGGLKHLDVEGHLKGEWAMMVRAMATRAGRPKLWENFWLYNLEQCYGKLERGRGILTSGCDFELLCQREQASERMGLCSGRRWRRTQR